jgi:uncharacterized membrane protein
MTKTEFLNILSKRLEVFGEAEKENWLKYYNEIIDDRIEDGQPEEEAVASLGDIDAIINDVLAQTPITKLAKAKLNRKTMRGWEIALLICGFPLWLPLIAAAFAVALAVYASLWSVIISLWAVFASCVACGISGIAVGIGFIVVSKVPSGVALLGLAFVCAGLSIFLFFGCKAATHGIILLTKKTVLGIKNSFIKREAAQ